ncbi:MAG: M1 family aminopeptidase [Bacteroidota bacterium]
MRFPRLLILFFLCCTGAINAQQMNFKNAKFSRERTVDILHYKFDIAISEKEKSIAGKVTVQFIPLRPNCEVVELEQEGLNITSAKIAENSLRIYKETGKVILPLDKPYSMKDTVSVVIFYNAKPKKGLYFIAPDSLQPNRNWQVWSHGQAEDNHWWFPCYDAPNDKATTEMIVTVNEKFTAISNGQLLEEKMNGNGTKTFHFFESHPISSYLISLVAGEYVKLSDNSASVPCEYYVRPSQKEKAQLSFSRTPEMISYYENFIGMKFPFEKYAQTVVTDFMYGGMENAGATTLNETTIHDERAHLDPRTRSDGLVAHELAHQWWGDVVTPRDWSHAWLSEGFASYFDNLWVEHSLGKDEMTWEMLGTKIDAMNADRDEKRPMVWNGFENPEDIFDSHIYAKGSATLDMLRFVLGDELFQKAIRYYIAKHAYQNVETNDFKIAIEEATGYNLQWFFNEWMYKAGYPEFVVLSDYDAERNKLKITIRQTQENDDFTGLFTMPVDIEIFTETGSEVKHVWLNKRMHEFEYVYNDKPLAIVFDKGAKIMKRVTFDRTTDELLYLLEHGDVSARIQSIEQLKTRYSSDDKQKVLNAFIQRISTDAFWGVRVNATEALGAIGDASIVPTVLPLLNEQNTRLRIAALRVLERFPSDGVVFAVKNIFEKDSSYTVAAQALSSLCRIDSANAKKYCQAGLKRESHREAIRITALKELTKRKDGDAVKLAKDFSNAGNATSLRTEAIGILGGVWKDTASVVKQLINLSSDPVFHVRRAAILALENYERKDVVAALKKRMNVELDNRIQKVLSEVVKSLEEILEPENQE